MVERCPHCHRIIQTDSSKYTPLQIEKCLEYLADGMKISLIVKNLGPDWSRANVYYYKKKFKL